MPTPPKKKAEPEPEVHPAEEDTPAEEVENPMIVETIDDPSAKVPEIDNSFPADEAPVYPTVVETIDDPDAEVPVIDNSVPPPEDSSEKEE